MIKIATRKSQLATWQANHVKTLLEDLSEKSELYPLVTSGDKLQKGPLADVHLENSTGLSHMNTGKGLFVKEIQEALLAGEAQIAVHSMKDLPVEVTPGLAVACTLERAPHRDILIVSPAVKADLPQDLSDYNVVKNALKSSQLFKTGVIGTTSLRRQLLLKTNMYPHLNCQILRGNVDTRLKKVASGEFSAIVLAEAGLHRLGLYDPTCMIPLPPDVYIPAPAQGVICVEASESRLDILNILQKLNHVSSELGALLERLALWLLGGDCHTAIGAHFSGNLKVFAGKDQQFAHTEFDFSLPYQQEMLLITLKKITFSQKMELVTASQFARDLCLHLKQNGFEHVSQLRVSLL